jgi:hypothetical protein
MPWKYDYAWRTLYLALSDMATSTGTVQDRLGNAAVCHLFKLQPSHLPAESQGRLANLMRDLSSVSATDGEGSIRATTAALDDERAVELAKQISSLFHEIDLDSRD